MTKSQHIIDNMSVWSLVHKLVCSCVWYGMHDHYGEIKENTIWAKDCKLMLYTTFKQNWGPFQRRAIPLIRSSPT